jgi:sortase A
MRRAIGNGAIGLGVLALGWVAVQVLDAWVYQRRIAQRLARARASAAWEPARSPDRAVHLPQHAIAEEAACIEVERIGLRAMIVPGDAAEALRRGIARIAGTALFAESGNVGLAAHRDTYFRGLRRIVVGDTIHVVTSTTIHSYAVEWVRIVEPNAIEVLNPTAERALTLVTCYPFDWIGPAPQRFVVRARGLEARSPPNAGRVGSAQARSNTSTCAGVTSSPAPVTANSRTADIAAPSPALSSVPSMRTRPAATCTQA